MEIELPNEIDLKLIQAAKLLEMNKGELICRAILVYLDEIGKYIDLQKEFNEWEKLSDESLENFENSL